MAGLDGLLARSKCDSDYQGSYALANGAGARATLTVVIVNDYKMPISFDFGIKNIFDEVTWGSRIHIAPSEIQSVSMHVNYKCSQTAAYTARNVRFGEDTGPYYPL